MSQLKRSLNVTDLTLIAIGSTIGSGIFKTPSVIAQYLPDPFWIMLIWAIGGVIALTGALTFSELGAAYPGSGGIYVFLREGYGKGVAFLYGWCILTVINTGSMAALATVFSDYLGELILISPLKMDIGNSGRLGVAIGGIAFLTWVSLKGAASGSRFSGLFTFLKIAGIAAIIIVGLGWGLQAFPDLSIGFPEQPMEKGLLACLGLALVKVLWTYGGWQHASYLAGDAKNPEKTVPRAMIYGALTVTVIYMLANLAYLKLLPLDEIQGNRVVAAAALNTIFGIKGSIMISVLIFISTFGTAGIYTLTAPRIYFAMAEDGLFFKKFAEVDPKTGTPVFAVIFQSAWAILLVIAWGTFEELIDYVVFVEWIFLTLAVASVFIHRKKSLGAQTGFRTPLYPLTPIIFIVGCTLFLVNTLVHDPEQAIAGLVIMTIGVVVGGLVFGVWKKGRNELK